VTRLRRGIVAAKARTLIIGAVGTLLLAWTTRAGNVTPARPKPVPAGTTIALTATTDVADPVKPVPIQAKLVLGEAPVEAVTPVKFRVIAGDARIEKADSATNRSGVAFAELVASSAGTVAVEATCSVKGCRGELTLQFAAAE
jgi:hypothetical protein